MVTKSVKLILDPTPEQVEIIQAHIKAAQFSYNYCLENLININEIKKNKKTKIKWRPHHSKNYQISFFELGKRLNAIKDDVAPWNKENSQYAFASGARDAAQDIDKILAKTSLMSISFTDLPQLLDEDQMSKRGVRFRTSNYGIRKNGKIFNLHKIGSIKISNGQERLQRLMQEGGTVFSSLLKREGDNWVLRVYVNEAYYYSY